MKRNIQRFVRNTFLMTGLTLTLLSAYAAVNGGSCLYLSTVFQCLAASACVQIGLAASGRFESGLFLLDIALDVAVSAVIVLVFGAWFRWFTTVPPWILLLMVAAVYAVCSVVRTLRVRGELREINRTLRRRAAGKAGETNGRTGPA